jgi:leader peptidase (prepilin peptidase) / N-methyltransferase
VAGIPPFDPALIILVLVVGLCLGSFLNVVIYRLPRGLSLLRPGSSCPACGAPIRPQHNLPLIGWLLLRGRCADCRAPISLRYPLIELGGGLLAGIAFFGLPLVWSGPAGLSGWQQAAAAGVFPVRGHWILVSLAALWLLDSLLAVLFIDLEHRIIPNEISLGGTAVGLVLSPWTIGLGSALVGAASGAGALFLVGWVYQKACRRDGMGLGDVKLAGMLGAFLGLKGVLLSVLLASFLGSLLGIGLIALHRGSRLTALPFGSFLAPAAAVALLWGPRIWAFYATFWPAR